MRWVPDALKRMVKRWFGAEIDVKHVLGKQYKEPAELPLRAGKRKSMMMKDERSCGRARSKAGGAFFSLFLFRCDLTTLSVDDLSRDQQMPIWAGGV